MKMNKLLYFCLMKFAKL